MTRRWKTTVVTVGGADGDICSTSYKTYSLKEAGAIINQLRIGEQQPGVPKRKIKPVSRYILEELIQQYFRSAGRKGAILESITVEDTKPNGL